MYDIRKTFLENSCIVAEAINEDRLTGITNYKPLLKACKLYTASVYPYFILKWTLHMSYKCIDWINMTQVRMEWRTIVNEVMGIRVPYKRRYLNHFNINFSRR
jgi:hypothetical protein